MSYKLVSLMRHLLIALFLFASTHIQLAANENKPLDPSLFDTLSKEYAVCSAYSTVIQAILMKAGDRVTAEKYGLQSKVAYQYASEYAKRGRTDEMANKLTLSRIQTHVQAMTEEFGNDASNISILVNRHSYKCKEAIVEPDAFRQLFQVETQKMD